MDAVDISVILFDGGGTLFYFDCSFAEIGPESDRAMVNELAAAGYRLPDDFGSRFTSREEAFQNEKSPDFLEKTAETILKVLLEECGYPSVPPETIQRALGAKFELTRPCWKLEPEAIAALSQLKEQGFRLGLVSNAGFAQNVDDLIDRHGLRPYFDLVIISARVGVRKPNPAIFRLALDYFKVQPKQAVMIGDTLGADILGAQNAGMPSIWITRRAARPDNQAHEDTIQPDAAVESLAEIPNLIRRWKSR